MWSKKQDDNSAQEVKNIIKPAVDIYETKTGVIVEAELPGVCKDSLNVELLNDQLTITGSRVNDQRLKDFNALYQECDSDAGYRRVFQLNSDIDQTSVQADLNSGLLRVKLTKKAETQPQKITITTST